MHGETLEYVEEVSIMHIDTDDFIFDKRIHHRIPVTFIVQNSNISSKVQFNSQNLTIWKLNKPLEDKPKL